MRKGILSDMRTMEFTTEKLDAFEIGQELSVSEYQLPTSYYYMIEHALGMSGNFKNAGRLHTFTGRVVDKKKTEMFNIVVLEFED